MSATTGLALCSVSLPRTSFILIIRQNANMPGPKISSVRPVPTFRLTMPRCVAASGNFWSYCAHPRDVAHYRSEREHALYQSASSPRFPCRREYLPGHFSYTGLVIDALAVHTNEVGAIRSVCRMGQSIPRPFVHTLLIRFHQSKWPLSESCCHITISLYQMLSTASRVSRAVDAINLLSCANIAFLKAY